MWNERETHEKIMAELSQVKGEVVSSFYINGNCYYWAVSSLPKGRAEEIAKRGNHCEIMYMIHQYGKTRIPDEKRHYLKNYYGVECACLSDDVQEILLQRNDRSELDAYISYQGFGGRGQDIILDKWSHDDIMWYLDRHGLETEQQRRLLQRGNQDEINLHISRHGLSNTLLGEMFDKIEAGGSLTEFYDYIKLHELSVALQKRMVSSLQSPEFQAYVSRYGLWNEVHPLMVEQRSEEDIIFYIKKHRYLDIYGEKALARRNSGRLNKIYVEYRVPQHGAINHFLDELLKVRPLDLSAIAACFLKREFSYDEPEKTREILKNGTHEEILAILQDPKSTISKKGLAILFFRNKPQEFEEYLKVGKFYYN